MSEKEYKILYKKLEKLGLSAKEAKVYTSLLSFGQPIGTSKIIQGTGLFGQYVYDALATLQEKGLVTHVAHGRRKRFLATHPSRLELLAEQQKITASEVSRELSALVQHNHVQDFSFYQGEDSFIAHELAEVESAKPGEEWLIIGGSGDRFIEIMDYVFEEYDRLRLKKRITLRYIGSEIQKEQIDNEKRISRASFEARILKGFGVSIVNTLIRPTKVSLSTYGNPVLTYEVHNPAVADSYRNFFEALWSKCEKV